MHSQLSRQNLILRFVFITLCYFILYLLNNRIQAFSPVSVPITFLDQMVSFKPNAIYIYLFAYILPALVFFRLWYKKNYQGIIFFQYHFLLTTLFSNLIFLLFPTTIINEYYAYSYEQILELSSPITASCLRFIYSADQPYNCLPSLHVAVSFVSAMSLHKDHKLLKYITYILVLWICLATMQVKQHLFYDALGGFLVSIITLAITKKFLKIKN